MSTSLWIPLKLQVGEIKAHQKNYGTWSYTYTLEKQKKREKLQDHKLRIRSKSKILSCKIS